MVKNTPVFVVLVNEPEYCLTMLFTLILRPMTDIRETCMRNSHQNLVRKTCFKFSLQVSRASSTSALLQSVMAAVNLNKYQVK